MSRTLSNRVWILLVAASVGVVVACSSSSTTTPAPDKDAGGEKEDAPKEATKG